MYSDLAVTNKQHCQSCILLVLYIIRTIIFNKIAWFSFIQLYLPFSHQKLRLSVQHKLT